MKWGDTQNLLSVIIGLNIAYYAFKEIRAPHINTFVERVRELYDDYTKVGDDIRLASDHIPEHATFQLELTKILLPILQYKMDVDMFLYDTTSRRFENLFGIPAMIVAVVGTLLLIISTVKFDDPLSLWAFYLIVLIGFAPIVVMLILNYGLLWHMKTKFGPDYDRYWKFVHLDMGGKLRPYAEIISRARHNRDHPDRRIPITD
jgi:hypothetical protein